MNGKHSAAGVVQTKDKANVSEYVRQGWKLFEKFHRFNGIVYFSSFAQNESHSSLDGSWSTAVTLNDSKIRINRSTGQNGSWHSNALYE